MSPQRKQRSRKPRRKRRSQVLRKKKFAAPQTLEEFLALPEADQDFWDSVGQIVTEVRNGSSLRQAARKFNRDQRLIRRFARPALRKMRNGRWGAKSKDKLLRVLPVLTSEGLIETGLRDSEHASLLGKYWSLVQRYLETGDDFGLHEFEYKYIVDTSGKRIPFITSLQELDRLGSAGVLSFETIYGRAS